MPSLDDSTGSDAARAGSGAPLSIRDCNPGDESAAAPLCLPCLLFAMPCVFAEFMAKLEQGRG
jgi:hypothetical protein